MIVLVTGRLRVIRINLGNYLISKKNIKKIIIVDNFSKSSCNYISSFTKYKLFNNSSRYKKSSHKIEIIKESINNYKFALKITKGIDQLIHLAAESGIDASINFPKHAIETNVNGTLNYLEAARINKVKNFIFASSGSVFGDTKPPMKENYPRNPISPYGSSKLTIETFCQTYSNVFSLNTAIIRFSNIYGCFSDHKTSVISKFIKKIINGEKLEIFGDGKQTRDFLYVDDVVSAIYKSLKNSTHCREYHVGTGKETSLNQLLKNLLSILRPMGYENTNISYVKPRSGDMRKNSLSTQATEKKLKWSAKTKLHDGLRKTVNWYINLKS